MNKGNLLLLQVLPADCFTLELYEHDNSIFNVRQPYKIPKIVGVCNAKNLSFRTKIDEVAIMFETRHGERFWFHAWIGTYETLLTREFGMSDRQLSKLLRELKLCAFEEEENE